MIMKNFNLFGYRVSFVAESLEDIKKIDKEILEEERVRKEKEKKLEEERKWNKRLRPFGTHSLKRWKLRYKHLTLKDLYLEAIDGLTKGKMEFVRNSDLFLVKSNLTWFLIAKNGKVVTLLSEHEKSKYDDKITVTKFTRKKVTKKFKDYWKAKKYVAQFFNIIV